MSQKQAKSTKGKICLVCNGTGKETSPKLYLMAYRSWVRDNEKMPEGARNLLEHILSRMQILMEQITGSMELSYRRGMQEGKERAK